MILPTGKLPPELLDDLLRRYSLPDDRLLVGPRAGEDAAVIDFRAGAVTPGGSLLVAKTDPITFATDEIGWYAVNVNANDVATMGAQPRWFLATVLLPAGRTTPALAERIFAQMHAACRELGIAMAGGHTEITHGLDRPMICGTLLGEVAPDDLVVTAGARVGDAVYFLRAAPIEGTALIAREKETDLLRRGVDAALVRRAQHFLHAPGISVVPVARLVCASLRPHSMHDPTEGGVVTGLWEIARAAGVGLRVDLQRVPVPAEGRVLCDLYGLDPLGTIASGGLLVTVGPEDGPRLVSVCQQAAVPVTCLGDVVDASEGVMERGSRSEWVPLRTFAADEITRLFADDAA